MPQQKWNVGEIFVVGGILLVIFAVSLGQQVRSHLAEAEAEAQQQYFQEHVEQRVRDRFGPGTRILEADLDERRVVIELEDGRRLLMELEDNRVWLDE